MKERPDFESSELIASYEIKGEVRVNIGWIGEGWCGDFDEDDPDDEPLLRFDVHDLKYPKDMEEEETWWNCRSRQDNSYCTQLPAWTPIERLQEICKAIAESVAGEEHWKRRLEEWSWIRE